MVYDPAKKYATPKTRLGRYVARRLRRVLCKLGRHGPWLYVGGGYQWWLCESCGTVFASGPQQDRNI